MKRLFLLLALPLAACHAEPPAVRAPMPTVAGRGASVSAASLPSGPLRSGDTDRPTDHDTLRGPHRSVLLLKPSTAAAFGQAPTELRWEADSLLTTTGRVRRVGSDLLLQPVRGPLVTFTTQLPAEGSSSAEIERQAEPHYWGQLVKAHAWVVQTRYMDRTVTTLVDQRTGRRTDVVGLPAASPDGRYLLSVSSDQGNDGSDQSATGLQLYRLTADGPRPLWTRQPRHWGAREARWTGPRTVLLRQDYEAASQDDDAPADTYVEIALPEPFGP